MPRRKRKIITRAKVVTQKKESSIKKSNNRSFKSFKWGESYTSLLLGVVVVVVGVLFAVSIIKQTRINSNQKPTQETSSISTTPSIVLSPSIELTPESNSASQMPVKPTVVPTQIQTGTINSSTYIVKTGDDLWHIAEKFYKSGYNWVDLAKANNLENPGVLYAGTKLVVPSVAPKI